MARFLIVYGTTEGHTRKIAEQVGSWIRERGNDVDVFDSVMNPPDLLDAYDAFLVAGSLHEGKHQRPLRHFVTEHAGTLSRCPSAFLSVSLSAVGRDDAHRADAQRCIDDFCNETGWMPSLTSPVAGALLYTKYDWLKRMVMRSIVRKEGGDIDTSQDYEYTDWTSLRAFVDSFLSLVESARVGDAVGALR